MNLIYEDERCTKMIQRQKWIIYILLLGFFVNTFFVIKMTDRIYRTERDITRIATITGKIIDSYCTLKDYVDYIIAPAAFNKF